MNDATVAAHRVRQAQKPDDLAGWRGVAPRRFARLAVSGCLADDVQQVDTLAAFVRCAGVDVAMQDDVFGVHGYAVLLAQPGQQMDKRRPRRSLGQFLAARAALWPRVAGLLDADGYHVIVGRDAGVGVRHSPGDIHRVRRWEVAVVAQHGPGDVGVGHVLLDCAALIDDVVQRSVLGPRPIVAVHSVCIRAGMLHRSRNAMEHDTLDSMRMASRRTAGNAEGARWSPHDGGLNDQVRR